MKTNLKYTNIPPSPAVETYIAQKIGELDKFINIRDTAEKGNAAVEAWVEVGRTTGHHKKGDVFRAEVQVKLPGKASIRAESVQPDLHLAIDETRDELERQLKRYKNKQRTKALRSARKEGI